VGRKELGINLYATILLKELIFTYVFFI